MLIGDSVYDWLNKTESVAKLYQTTGPFPHIVLDGLFDPQLLDSVRRDFPYILDGKWWSYQNALERKLARNDLHNMPRSIQSLIHELQSHRFVSLLESITCIPGLIVDHTLNGGGLHQILGPGKDRLGGKLDIHADYNYHPTNRLDRRLNVLVYLNKGWKPEWKGNLEFWNQDMSQCVRSIEPIFNRMVIFNVTDTAYHGHPEPLECPEYESRKSIALYYYTNGRPESERSEPHSTLFQRRPQDAPDPDTEKLRIQRAKRRLT